MSLLGSTPGAETRPLTVEEAWPQSSELRCLNVNAGPGPLPELVLRTAQDELLNFAGTGMSIMEMSHRSKEFMGVIKQAEQDLRAILNVPDNYSILFMQGGATMQFASVPMHLLGMYEPAEGEEAGKKPTAHYIVTGIWSKKAAEEATKYLNVEVIATSKNSNFTQDPEVSKEVKDSKPLYVYYCANETVHGVELNSLPVEVSPGTILVADFSSNFCSAPIDISKFGVIFAGAQKNVGPAGVTIVIARNDIIARSKALKTIPTAASWALAAENDSMYNTPPCYSIYMCGLVFKWIRRVTIEKLTEINLSKAQQLYDFLDASDGFYRAPVAKHLRSRMNVVFRVKDGNEALEKALVKHLEQARIIGAGGHRSVGGMRISLYNAVSPASIPIIIAKLKEFQELNSQ